MADRDSQITYKSQNLEESLVQPVDSTAVLQQTPKKPIKQRLNSLDILRGITMVGMIMVDCKGKDAPWWLRHPSWYGLSPADFVFPSFVFIMGMAVPLALNKNKPFSIKTVLRVIGLFVIGFLINYIDEEFDFEHMRYFGILQRISVCYLIVSLIHVVTRYGEQKYRFIGFLIAFSIGMIYVVFMSTFQNLEIGCPYSLRYTRPCNFGGYFDRTVFGRNHIASGSDPEGFFANTSVFLNGYIGYWFCLVMQDNKANIKKTLFLWTVFSVMLGIISYPLTFLMPYHKRMWTVSYVFLTSAASGIVLVMITYLFDVLSTKKQKIKKVTDKIMIPFIWLGRNPLAIYTLMQLSNIIMALYIKVDGKNAVAIIYQNLFLSWISDKEVASVIQSVFFLLIWGAVAALLFKFNIFIKL